MTRKVRTLLIDVDSCEAACSWANSGVVIKEYDTEGEAKRVTIKIDSPAILDHIRCQLDKIEKGWQQDLKRIARPMPTF